MKKELILIIICILASLLQTSFLVPLQWNQKMPNLCLIVAILIVYFLPHIFPPKSAFEQEIRPQLFIPFLAGSFLDIFSAHSFSFFCFIFILISLIIQKSLKSFNRFNIFLFLIVFAFSLMCYHFFFELFQIKNEKVFSFDLLADSGFFTGVLYNLLTASFFYLLFSRVLKIKQKRQKVLI